MKPKINRQNLAVRISEIAQALDENVVVHLGVRRSGQIDLIGIDILQMKEKPEKAKGPDPELSYIG